MDDYFTQTLRVFYFKWRYKLIYGNWAMIIVLNSGKIRFISAGDQAIIFLEVFGLKLFYMWHQAFNSVKIFVSGT